MGILGLAFSLLNLLAIGLALSWGLFADADRRRVLPLIIFSPLVGLVATSLFFFAAMFLWGPSAGGYLLLETMLAAVLMYTLPWSAVINRAEHAESFSVTRMAAESAPPAFALIAIIAVTTFLVGRSAVEHPLGFWDAWSRINVKASFLMDASTANEAVGAFVHHADYPLLLPASIGRFWLLIGDNVVFVPQAIGVAISAWVLVVLAWVISELQSILMALIAVVGYLSSDIFWIWSAAQYTDILLSIFIVTSFFYSVRLLRGDRTNLGMYFFGVAASLWCKNEGIAFAAISLTTTIGLLLIRDRKLSGDISRAGFVGGLGLAAAIAATAFVKLSAPETTDIFRGESRFAGGFDLFSRLQLIGRSFGEEIAMVATLALGLAIVAAGIVCRFGPANHSEPPPMRWLPLATLFALAVVYVGIYLITPHDLEFHLSTSMDRLILQLWAPVIVATSIVLMAKRHEPSTVSETAFDGGGEV